MRCRYDNVIRCAVGSDYSMQFRAILESSGSVLLSSPALDPLLLGTMEAVSPDLRIAVPNEGVASLIEGIQKIGFKPMLATSQVSSDPLSSSFRYGSSLINTSMTSQPMLSAFAYETFERFGILITIIHGQSSSVIPIVLSQRSSVDCLFVTSGGLFIGYPAYLKKHVAYTPAIHSQSPALQSLTKRGYDVQCRNDQWSQPCDSECPTLWRRIPDGQFIQWGDGISPFAMLNGQSFLWRLSWKCYNSNCIQNSLSFGNPPGVPTSHEDVMLVVEQARQNNPKTHGIRGMLFAQATDRPIIVPIFLDKGRTRLRSIDDLNLRHYVRENGIEVDYMIDGSSTRQTFISGIYAYTMIRDHHEVFNNLPSMLLNGPIVNSQGHQYLPMTPPRSNILVIKHAVSSSFEPKDMQRRDFKRVSELLIKADEAGNLFNNILRTSPNF
ncbi:hypothetical protein C8R48DRAFT_779742 [Suillus tomentosus]|nr:hypothetical protein C8R48DRAFT_779742 [Suillus tomentosus]